MKGNRLQVFFVIKWAGAAYLIWLGARMIVRSFRARSGGASPPNPVSGRRSVWQGFVAQGANPNLLVYVTAILPHFVDPARPLASQVAVPVCRSFVIEFTVLSVYAAFAFRAGRHAAPRFRLAGSGAGFSWPRVRVRRRSGATEKPSRRAPNEASAREPSAALDRYDGVRAKQPAVHFWGRREIHRIDPAGVCWHFA